MEKTKLPLSRKWLFALGQLGWSLASFAPANLLPFFYLPPADGSGDLFPVFISATVFFGILTWLGLLSAGGRLFDAVTDPLVAGWSDRSKFKDGRRIPFLAVSALPFALLSTLIFVPPVASESLWNVVWLAVVLFLYYFALTTYVTPYNALYCELGKDTAERLDISTMISLTWALGLVVGNTSYILLDVLNPIIQNRVLTLQIILGGFSLLSFILMMLPVIAIKESRDIGTETRGEPFYRALKRLWRNPNFRWFLGSDLMYWMSITFIQVGISYYVIVLLGLEKGWTSIMFYIMFFGSFLFYVPINRLARRWGKKKMVVFSFGLIASLFGMVAFLGILPLPPLAQGIILSSFFAVPLAIFGILPTVIIADMSQASLKTSGFGNEGVYFGIRTFVMKVGIAFANLLFPWLLDFGRTTENSFGIRLTGVVAFGICVLGLILMAFYDEKKVMRDLA